MSREHAPFPTRTPEPDETTGPKRTAGLERAEDAAPMNWARNAVLATAGAVVAPTTEDQVRAALAASAGRVRVAGSRMSAGRMMELAGRGDTLLDLRGLRGVLQVTEGTATFAGGTPLGEVYETLTALGRALPCSPGVIAEQTLAGALATGTHGQGLGQSSIAEAAQSITAVLADGSVASFERGHPWFGAAQLGLGCLGVVTRATLRTVALPVYTCVKDAVGAEHLATDLVAWNTEHAMAKAWWFPAEDQVHVWAAREADEAEVRRYREGGSVLMEHERTSAAMNATVEATLGHMRDDTRIADANGKPFRTVARFKDFSDVTGDVYQVFCRGIATPQINVEIGVPLSRAGAVVEKIKAWHAETKPHLHYPVILRCTGASEAWLSPSSGEATCWFGFVVYYAEDGTLSSEGTDFLREVEVLLAAQGGRPHWGKYFDASLYDWAALYPRWEEFRAVREALDPDHRFANAFTAALLDR